MSARIVSTGVVPGRGRRSLLATLGLIALLAATVVGCGHGSAPPLGLPCHAAVGTQTYALDASQAANAATIAAVAKRMVLPDHAVTVALAAALQESKLYNLPYGDLDSLGLFQQRPSQGWGTKDQILTPRDAARAFFTRLVQVAGWETLAVTDAAQAVQHSAAPDAYAQWESEARVLAQALTGELPAAFACQTPAKPAPAATAQLLAADLAADLGAPTLGAPLEAARGWQVAGWLIAHAGEYGVATVTFGGQRWSGGSGAWVAHPPSSSTVEVNR